MCLSCKKVIVIFSGGKIYMKPKKVIVSSKDECSSREAR